MITWKDTDYPNLTFIAETRGEYTQVIAKDFGGIVLILEIKGISEENAKEFVLTTELNPLFMEGK